MSIQGKTALVTGATRGIGRAIVLELQKRGIKRLILVARDRQRLGELATEIKASGVEAIALSIDLTKSTSVNLSITSALRSYGPVDILINCAGVAHQTPFLQSRLLKVREEISLNLIGTYTITRLVARQMAARKQGTIVNVSSLMGKLAAPTMATYSATKFALLGFTQALRGELSPYNIRVIALLPTLTETDMAKNLKLFRWIMPMTADRVAQKLVNQLEKKSIASEILVGWQSHLASLCQRLAPALMEKVLLMAAPIK
jgi:3-oxoacyl-[acyl-carrier protein] reductase